MGFRFRKSFNVVPGVKINLSKSGASVSLGRRGLSYNIGRKGNRATVGLPGSGASYSSYQSHGRKGGSLFMWIVLLLVLAYVAARYFNIFPSLT